MKSILVLGVGNVLLSDEGAGVHVAQQLQKNELPSDVEVIDGGTGGYELIGFLSGRRKVIIVDCLRAEEPPGTVIRATPEDLDLGWPEPLSVHQSGLRELLYGAKSLIPLPHIIILGIVPETVDTPGMSLSVTLQSRIDAIVSKVLEEAASG